MRKNLQHKIQHTKYNEGENIMKRFCSTISIFTILLFITSASVFATVPQLITYQGRLQDSVGDPVEDGLYGLKFIIYDAPTSGVELWNSEFNKIDVVDGLFTVQLGSDNMPPIDNNMFLDSSLYLGVTLEGIGEMTPRSRLITVPFSYHALRADTALSLPDGSVTNDMLADDAVTGDKIANGTITTQDMLDEPGLSYNSNASTIPLPNDAMTDLVSDYIDIPNPGYIVVTGKCYCKLAGTTAANGAFFQIDETAGGTFAEPWHTYVAMDAFPTTGSYYYPVFVSRVFYKSSAGRYNFRLEGRQIPTSTGTAESRNHVLIITYMGTYYGKI